MVARRFGDAAGSSGVAVQSSDILGSGQLARVFELVDQGALVSLSRSRDGGALAVTVTWDGEWERKWFREAADAQLALDEWAGLIEDLAGASGGPPAAQQVTRRRRPGRS